jgi:hypothetical protein
MYKTYDKGMESDSWNYLKKRENRYAIRIGEKSWETAVVKHRWFVLAQAVV